MKKTLIIIYSLIFIGCGKSREERKEQHENEKRNYEANISIEHKNAINQVFENEKYLEISEITSKNKILVLQKWKGEIIPYTEINNKLKDKGFNIEFDSNNVDYIVCVKSTGIKAGNYTDGSNAWDTKTEIFVIDSKNNNEIFLIASDYQKTPETIRTHRNSEPGNYGSRGLEGTELAELIKSKI
jgi:hypothetical protein